jgi:putative transcriptional regulator
MPIEVRLAEVMADRGVSAAELSRAIGLTAANVSILKNGHAKAIRFSTLDAICEVLRCDPGDILERGPSDTHP